ncbi:hypothetical protein CRT60_16465 [Azospirillum palustre]|uniref:Helix-turn-helix domain-containing protein n=2 Tax=Azospirillum palustre TaxID=2044885 RepID=A0A2B8BF40_9PROT|nr:hypothetical protein CRT60_16465 [Azospirillum palustre]
MEALMAKRFMTIAEFSTETGLPRPTVRNLVRDSKLRGTKVGRAWLIPADEVDRLAALADGRIESA